MENMGLSPHEAIEIKELLSQEMLALKKISSNVDMVKDKVLKKFMEDLIESKKTAIQQISISIPQQIQNT
jgi:similar to spore coat protein